MSHSGQRSLKEVLRDPDREVFLCRRADIRQFVAARLPKRGRLARHQPPAKGVRGAGKTFVERVCCASEGRTRSASRRKAAGEMSRMFLDVRLT